MEQRPIQTVSMRDFLKEFEKSSPGQIIEHQEEAIFSIGDTVRLKSGGPCMTVLKKADARSIDKSMWYETVWFGENLQLHSARLEERTLVLSSRLPQEEEKTE